MKKVILLLCLCLAPRLLFSDSPAMLNVIDTDFNARAKTLGSIIAASGDDINSFMVNPAGLAYIPYSEVGITYNKLLMDTKISNAGYIFPCKSSGLGVTLVHFDGGTFDKIENGELKESISAEKDTAFAISYGREIMNNISAGLTGKYIYSEFLQNYSASSYAVDFGLLWKPPQEKFSIGAAINNLGKPIRYRSTYEGLPVQIKTGTMVSVLDSYKHKCVLGGGVNWKSGIKDLVYDAGAEYTFNEMLTLRCNYSLDKTHINPFSLGMGFVVWQNQLDYMWSNTGVEDIHRITVSARFGQKGSFGKGAGFYKRKMYQRANNYLEKVPKNNQDYIDAQKLLHRNDGEYSSCIFSESSPMLEFFSIKYPVSISIMRHIPLAVYNILSEYNAVPCSVSITNNTNESTDFSIKYRYDFQYNESIKRARLMPMEKRTFYLYPLVPSSFGANINTQKICNLYVSVYNTDTYGKSDNLVADLKEPVTFHPNNQYFKSIKDANENKIDLLDTLCAWIVNNDPSLMDAVSRAGERGKKHEPPIIIGDPYNKKLLKQIELIYNTLKDDYDLAYLSQPIIDNNGNLYASQRVKYPVQTLKNQGNCIELSVLFASLFESIGINSIIMLLPNEGHCVVGWEESDIEANGVKYRLLETNQVGQDFDSVLKEANVWIQKYGLKEQFSQGIDFDKNGIFQDENVIIFNVQTIRKRIPPSPYIPSFL